jgi:hypothetical protein
MACGCIGKPIVITDPNCEDCLKIVSLRYACANGPAPCGGDEGTLVEDLSLLNDVDACDCGEDAVYSIVSYDTDAFESVTITSGGVLTAITTDNFVSKKEYLIVYKVDCPCSILSATGNIYVCMENLCAGKTCDDGEYCDQCDGLCKESESDLGLGGSVTTFGSGGTGFVV